MRNIAQIDVRVLRRGILLCLFALTVLGSQADAANLLGYYEFENNYDDSAGLTAPAEPVQGPTFETLGFRGAAASIIGGGGGGGAKIDLPISANPSDNPEITFGGWVNVNAGIDFDGWLSSDNGGWDRGMTINRPDGQFGIASGAGPTAGGAVTYGEWQFVTGTFSKPDNAAILYVGSDDPSDPTTTTGTTADAVSTPGEPTIEVGRYDNQDMDGLADDIFVFEGALDAYQVNAIRNLRLSSADLSPADTAVLFDLFDQGAGTANVGGLEFTYTTGLDAALPGEVQEAVGFSVVLDADGNGLSAAINPFQLNGGGETYSQNFDEALGLRKGALPKGWSAQDVDGAGRRVDGFGLTDGFLTLPGDESDRVLGVLNLGGNESSFGPAPDGHVPTWTAELGGDSDLFGRDDVLADNASDRALGIGRENAEDPGELNFEIEIAEGNLRAFVLDWDLEIWGGDPDTDFRSSEGPGMKVDVMVGGNSYDTMTKNLLPGELFDSIEDGNSDHNATLIDGNVHSVRNITSGIKEVSDADGAVGNMVQINFNTDWNNNSAGPGGWFTAIDNVQLRALAPGDADANGVVDVTDLLQLLGGQKFNQGVDGVTWEQGDFNADDQFDTGDLLAMLSFLSGTFPSDPYASEAGGANDAVADIIVNSETGEVTVNLAGHTVSAVIIESASEIFNGSQPEWDTTSQFPSTLPGELGNVLFTSTAAGVDELGAVISAEFLGRDKDFYLQDLDLNILIASEGGALTKGNVIVVPEPSTWMLLGLGSLAIVGAIRRRMT